MSEKQITFSANLPRYQGRGLSLEIEIRRSDVQPGWAGSLSVDLAPVSTFEELSICGAGGQNREATRAAFPGDPIIGELCDLWDRWHLNGVRAATRRQSEFLALVESRTGKSLESYEAKKTALEAGYASGELARENRPAEPRDTAALEAKATDASKAAGGFAAFWAGQTNGMAPDAAAIAHARKLAAAGVKEFAGLFTPTEGGKVSYGPALVAQALAGWWAAEADRLQAEVDRIKAEGVPYSYGSDWLSDPLPPEVRARIVELAGIIAAGSAAPARAEGTEASEDDEPEADDAGELWVEIDGERWEVDSWNFPQDDERGGVRFESGSLEWLGFPSEEAAGAAARAYWADMAKNDPEEFACLVGEKTLVAWGLGQSAGPGSGKVSSLAEWLDLTAESPEEHFARYDGEACEITGVSPALAEEIGADLVGGPAYREG